MMAEAETTKDKSKKEEEPMAAGTFMVPLNDEPRSARRSGKDRSIRFKGSGSNSLDKSFTEFLDTSAPDEIEEFTTEIETALSSLPKSVSGLAKAERRPSGEHYHPVRRPSRAGSELAKTMKETAAAALLELEGIDDDDSDEELNGLGMGEVKIQG
jgi:hypothetical protein